MKRLIKSLGQTHSLSPEENFLASAINAALVVSCDGRVQTNKKFEAICENFNRQTLISELVDQALENHDTCKVLDTAQTEHICYFAFKYEQERLFISFIKLEKSSDRVKVIAPINKEATHDPLTGLLSRAELEKQFDTLKNDGNYYMYLTDIDYFKSINDIFGHSYGDEALITAGELVTNAIKDKGIAGRIGGEEFAVLRFCENERDAIKFGAHLNAVFREFALIKGHKINRTISIGFTQVQNKNFTQCYEEADQVLRFVKQNGRNSSKFYDDKFKLSAAKTCLELDAKNIMEGLEKRQFVYEQQNIYDFSKEGNPVGATCNLRWHSSGSTMVSVERLKVFHDLAFSPTWVSQVNQLRASPALVQQSLRLDFCVFQMNLNALLACQDIKMIRKSFAGFLKLNTEIYLELSHQDIRSRMNFTELKKRMKMLSAQGFKFLIGDVLENSCDFDPLLNVPHDGLIVNFDQQKDPITKINLLSMLPGIENKIVIATNLKSLEVQCHLRRTMPHALMKGSWLPDNVMPLCVNASSF